jgi:hypothetical protein
MTMFVTDLSVSFYHYSFMTVNSLHFVTGIGLFYGLMELSIGCSAITCLLHLDFLYELQRNIKLNKELKLNCFKTCSSPEIVAHAAVMKELLMIRDRCLFLPQSYFQL